MQFVQWASSMLDSVDQQAQSTVTAIREKKLPSLTPSKSRDDPPNDSSNKCHDTLSQHDSKQQPSSDHTSSTSKTNSTYTSEPQSPPSPDVITPITRSRTLASNSSSKRSSLNRSAPRSDKKRILIRSVDDSRDNHSNPIAQPQLDDTTNSTILNHEAERSVQHAVNQLGTAIDAPTSATESSNATDEPQSPSGTKNDINQLTAVVDSMMSNSDDPSVHHDATFTGADMTLESSHSLGNERTSSSVSEKGEPDVDFDVWNDHSARDKSDVLSHDSSDLLITHESNVDSHHSSNVQPTEHSSHESDVPSDHSSNVQPTENSSSSQSHQEPIPSPLQIQSKNNLRPEVLVSHMNPYDALELSTPGSVDSSFSHYDDIESKSTLDAPYDEVNEPDDMSYNQSDDYTSDHDAKLYSNDQSPDEQSNGPEFDQPDNTQHDNIESVTSDIEHETRFADDNQNNEVPVDSEEFDEHEFDDYTPDDILVNDVRHDESVYPSQDLHELSNNNEDDHSPDQQLVEIPPLDQLNQHDAVSDHERTSDTNMNAPTIVEHEPVVDVHVAGPTLTTLKPSQPIATAAPVPNATASKFAAAFSNFITPRVNPLAAVITAATASNDNQSSTGASAPPVKQLISPSSLSSLRNRLAESEAEVASLRNVWNETREQLSKAKKLVSMKEESYSKRVEQLQDEWRGIVKEQAQSFEAKIEEMCTSMSNSQADFAAALEAKRAYEHQIENQAKQTQNELANLQQHVEQLQQRAYELETEKEELTMLHHEELANHSQLIARLRAEEAERMASLEAELRARSSSLTRSHHMEHVYDEEQILAIKQAAQTQHELKERTRQLERAVSEKRWLESDHQALQEEMQSVRARYDTEHKQAAAALASARERNVQLNSRIDELTSALQEEQQAHTATQLELTHTKHALDTKLSSNAPEDRSNDFEDRIKAMAEHLIAKTSALDRVQAERNSLQLQLDKQLQVVSTLERQLKNAANDRDEESDVALDISPPLRTTRRRVLPQVDGGVGRTLTALDRVGAQASVLLRRYPAARVAFGLYILLIHLWSCFILVHLINESGQTVKDPFDVDVKHFRGLGNG